MNLIILIIRSKAQAFLFGSRFVDLDLPEPSTRQVSSSASAAGATLQERMSQASGILGSEGFRVGRRL